MASKIKQLVKSGLIKACDLIGVHTGLSEKDGANGVIAFDTKSLESYAKHDEKIQLYYEGLIKSKMEWSDNFPKQCRFYSLQQMAAYIMNKGILGDFAECGCWKGHSAYIISKILYENNFSRSFHIFDAFEGGLSDKTEEDENEHNKRSKEAVLKQKLFFASTEDELRNTIKEFDFIKIYNGWIPERFSEVEQNKFAFIHIDVDLYQPTLDSLEFFFPKLQSGGVIVVDDYGYTEFPGAKKAVDKFLKENDHYLFYETPMGSCFIIK